MKPLRKGHSHPPRGFHLQVVERLLREKMRGRREGKGGEERKGKWEEGEIEIDWGLHTKENSVFHFSEC